MEGRLTEIGQRLARRRPSRHTDSGPSLAQRLRGRLWPLPFAALATLAPAVVFFDGLTGRRLLAPGEAYTYNLPLHTLVGRMWRHGQLPAWNTWSFSGSPLLATGQPGAFYPVNGLFVVLPPVVANNLAVVSGFALTALGGFLLGRHLTGDPAAGAVTGLAFAFCAFFFAHLPHQAVLDSAAWLPWLLYGFERLRERLAPGRVVVGGGALGLCILAGHFQTAAIGLALLVIYAVVVFAIDARPARSRPRTLLGLGLVLVIGFGLSAAQWMATGNIIGSTDRAHVPFDVATSYSLRPSHLALIGFPYLFGGGSLMAPYLPAYRGQWNLTELSGYPGMAAAVLAAVGVVAARKDRRVWALVLLGVVSVYASLGSSTQFGSLIYRLPLYGQFRSWARFIVVLDLVVAVLAGYGVAALRSAAAARRQADQPTLSIHTNEATPPANPDEPATAAHTDEPTPSADSDEPATAITARAPSARLLLAVAAGAAGLVVVAAAVATSLPHVRLYLPHPGPPIVARLLPALAAVAAFAVAALMVRRPRAAGYLCCAVVLLDAVGTFGWSMAWRSSGVLDPSTAATAVRSGTAPNFGSVAPTAGGVDRYVIASDDLGPVTYPQVNAASQVRSVNGFDPLAPVDYLVDTGFQQYNGGIKQPDDYWRPGSDLPDLLRISTVVVPSAPEIWKPPPGSPLGTPRPVVRGQVLRFDRTPSVADAFVVGATRRVTHAEARQAVQGLTPFDPRLDALVEERCVGCPASTAALGPAGSAERRADPNTELVDVRADRPAVLVVSEAWFPGWQVTVDGRPAHVLRADALLLGVAVPAGRHAVRFHYQPPGLITGLVISAVTVLVLAAWWLLDHLVRRRDRRRRREAVNA